MGCDIHFFIEYKNKKGTWDFLREEEIRRNYSFFSVLAGVRRAFEKVDFFKPKGIPKDISPEILSHYTLFVVNGKNNGHPEYCTKEQAEEYNKLSERRLGKSGWWDENKTRIIHPDWHSVSWLSLEELELAYERYLNYFKEEDLSELDEIKNSKKFSEKEKEKRFKKFFLKEPKYVSVSKILKIDVIISTMKAFEEARVVFWFDS